MAASSQDSAQTGLTRVENKEAPALRRQQSPISLIDHWDPFSLSTRSLKQMMKAMERVLSEAPTTTMSLLEPSYMMRVPWDAVEDDECYKVRIDLLGFNKEEVKVQVEDGDLIVNAEHIREEENQQQEKKWWSTRTHGKYYTRIALPESVEATKVTAKLSNGVLEVWIPKIKMEKQVLDVKLE